MAISKCIKCKGTTFEAELAELKHSDSKVYLVQCADCGGVVGVQHFFDIPTLLAIQNVAINKIAKKMGIRSKLPEAE